jgi:hypothetical protein
MTLEQIKLTKKLKREYGHIIDELEKLYKRYPYDELLIENLYQRRFQIIRELDNLRGLRGYCTIPWILDYDLKHNTGQEHDMKAEQLFKTLELEATKK